MHAEKNKGADQSAQLNSRSALLFSLNQPHTFHSLSHDATFTMPRILKYVNIMHLQLIFNACTVIVVLLCFGLLQY